MASKGSDDMNDWRRSIEVEGFNHGPQPIPAACRVGNVVMTGGIYGLDTQTGKVPGDLERQTSLMMANLGLVLSAAGTSAEHVVKMTFWVRNSEARAFINPQWLVMFPDPKSRPARHTVQNDHMPLNLLVQCDAFAVIPSGL
jgi:enamine deaminase RidA (YjgF/YER057c/UK114 family)